MSRRIDTSAFVSRPISVQRCSQGSRPGHAHLIDHEGAEPPAPVAAHEAEGAVHGHLERRFLQRSPHVGHLLVHALDELRLPTLRMGA